jgi:hypothetical protein
VIRSHHAGRAAVLHKAQARPCCWLRRSCSGERGPVQVCWPLWCRLQLSCPGADSMWCYCRSAQSVESPRGRTPQLTAQSRAVGCSDGCEPMRTGSGMCFPQSWPACGSSRLSCGCEAGAPSATAEPHEDGEQLTLVLCHQPECYCYLLVPCRAYPARSFCMELELQSSNYSCASL